MPGQPGWQRGSGRGAGIIPLRPLSIGEIYDGAIRAIRANPRTMVGWSAVVGAIITVAATIPQLLALNALWGSALSGDALTTEEDAEALSEVFGVFGVTALSTTIQSLLATTIITGLLIVAVGGAVRGEALAPGELWRRAKGRLWAVLGLAVLLLVTATVLIAVCMAPGGVLLWQAVQGDADAEGIFVAFLVLALGGLVGAIVYAALYLGYWALAVPALLLENLGMTAALRRSARLVRGSFWRVFGISLLTAVIAAVIGEIFTVPFSLVGNGVVLALGTTGPASLIVPQLLVTLGTIMAGAVLYPFSAGAVTLLYLDLRMRREGMDVEMLRSEQPR
ncbi:glycerophosphoryl diester phosphodiesterase membrane domain-containing protein [Kineosporia succinea]|uniref:Glycerophosphoryl diester phosphodiesterase membrane domain-containing protein n=1 Tax=Kineosporia succinea TaxID=84632 RepID=A0ABT9NY84_9ACTN|nr:hypothetical protein [Kineosporia succinea]MDP9825387.1 hypothetical protein [Kineosporia succinea]